MRLQRWLVVAGVCAGLAVSAAKRAPEPEDKVEQVIGRLDERGDSSLRVKTADGKSVLLDVDAQTRYIQGKQLIRFSDLSPGDRVRAVAIHGKGTHLTCLFVQLNPGNPPAN